MDMGGKEKLEAFEAMELRELSNDELARYGNWVIMETGEDDVCEASTSTIDSSSESSINSMESSSSELVEDASSSSNSNPSLSPLLSPSPLSSGPLYELSELMVNLPIKRGLSKFYHGKSQSFTSLASAKSLEDLAKRVNNIPQRKKMKSCKSYGGGLDSQRSSYSPKALIAKKASKGSFLSPVCKRNNRLFDSH